MTRDAMTGDAMTGGAMTRDAMTTALEPASARPLRADGRAQGRQSVVKPRVLIVEDEEAQAEMLRYNCEREGFEPIVAHDGETALEAVDEHQPDLVLLDWMLPGASGVSVCQRLRKRDDTRTLPVIILTARGEEGDRVRGLECGADDYVVKPFSPSELIARMRAVLRRARPALTEDRLVYGDIVMDLSAHRVTRGGRTVHLGPTEYRLLQKFLERPDRVFSREQLLDKVWGPDIHVELRTVDVHIRRLRKALNESGGVDVIRTVRGAGYALDAATV
jgi:two-component system, OmpR family, phosphate regulon response regulator PhoB